MRAGNAKVAARKPTARSCVSNGRADWTRQDPEITRELEANGRAGVPLYFFYPKPKLTGQRPSPIILPQILTADSILREVLSN
jgi:thiol:disulfide interchange protein DsbD